ncbi:unnamed protein product, partial [Staurois parvus]
SCDQLCPITADRIRHADRGEERRAGDRHSSEGTYTLTIRALMIRPQQCHLSVSISASCQCPSELPFSVNHQCHLSVLPVSATYQCQSVPPISASQCRLSVCISAA